MNILIRCLLEKLVGIEEDGIVLGGPLWCDIKEFISQPKFSPYYQIFGHTQLKNYITKDMLKKENPEIDCDNFACLDCRKAFIIDENGIQEWKN